MMGNQFISASTDLSDVVARVLPSVVQVSDGRRGAGSGVIWRTDGIILTNYHVVARQSEINVELRDGRIFAATLINQNEAADLALLQIDATDLPAAPIDDSSTLRVGELVVAVGHPWGQKYIITAGVVSAIGTLKDERNGRTAHYIRSDVALAPGNSGGPMLNAHGAVVGINAMIFGGDLSVAIPSVVAREWVAGLPSRRVQLSIGVQPVELPQQWQRDRVPSAALLVTAVPAHAPLFVGDVLLDVGGEPIGDIRTFANALGRRAGNEQVRLNILRGGQVQPLDVTVEDLEQAV
jgi:serine protease Do